MADLPVSLAPPRLEHFVITEKLGQGTYATVYKAFRKVTNFTFFVKTCFNHFSSELKNVLFNVLTYTAFTYCFDMLQQIYIVE